MSLLRISTLSTLAFLLLFGCGKKNEEVAPKAEKAVSEELFDEFYEENSTETDVVEESVAEEVVVEEPVTEFDSQVSEPVFSTDGRYVVQVSCIASEEIAEDVARKFENKGYPVYIAEVKNPTPQLMGTYFRVRIGGFDGINSAKAFGEDFLLTSGFEYWVDNRSNDNVGIGDYGLGDDAGDFTYEEDASETESVETESTFEEETSFDAEPVSETSYDAEPTTETSSSEPVVDETVGDASVDDTSTTSSSVETTDAANDTIQNSSVGEEWDTSDW